MFSIWGPFCPLWCFQASWTRVWKYQIMVLANVKWISFSLTMCETGLEWKLTKGPGAPSLYFQVIRHEKINRVGARCNPLPDYNFTSCLIESKAKKVNCTMPWSFQIEGKSKHQPRLGSPLTQLRMFWGDDIRWSQRFSYRVFFFKWFAQKKTNPPTPRFKGF